MKEMTTQGSNAGNWENDGMCFVCGKRNTSGLKLDFNFDAKNRELSAKCRFEKKHQGFRDVIHGGFIAMLLDEVMVNLSIRLGISAVTAEMTFRLKRPAKVGEEITFIAGNAREAGRLITVEARALAANGSPIATSSAKLFRVK